MELLYVHGHGKGESCCWAMVAVLIGSLFESSYWAEIKPNLWPKFKLCVGPKLGLKGRRPNRPRAFDPNKNSNNNHKIKINK